jgi:hypothetical protein
MLVGVPVAGVGDVQVRGNKAPRYGSDEVLPLPASRPVRADEHS